MINRGDNPVQWALWLDELNQAHEHLGGSFNVSPEHQLRGQNPAGVFNQPSSVSFLRCLG
jgi:hypothetical protein